MTTNLADKMNAVGAHLPQLNENLASSFDGPLGRPRKGGYDFAKVGLGNHTEHRDSDCDHTRAGSNSNKTSEIQAMMHILKANIAVGVLAMPSAFKNVGLWLGLLLVPLIGATCIHCMNILIQCHNHLCDKFNYEALDYDQVAALGLACGPKLARRLAKRAHVIVLTLLMFTQVGFCCVYILFVAENIQIAMLSLFELTYPTTTYMWLMFPVIWLTSCTSNLRHLARISTLANFLQLTGLSLIFYDLVRSHTYGVGLAPVAAAATINQTESDLVDAGHLVEVDLIFSEDLLGGLPLFFATAVYAFEGIGVVLPVAKEMRYPERISGLNGVLNTSMSLVAILYMGMGFFGYAKYGQFVKGSITFNLPETTLYDLVRLMFAFAIGLSYSLQFYVPWTIMWPYIDEGLFYSYRPREQRDKLDILNKLSADNEWALLSGSGSIQEEQRLEDSMGSKQVPGEPEREEEEDGGKLHALDYNSTASTFATSYTMSSYLQPSFRFANLAGLQHQQQQQQQRTTRLLAETSSLLPPVGSTQQSPVHYGSSAEPASQLQHQQAAVNRAGQLNIVRGQKRRNRYADVMQAEQGCNYDDDDDDEQLPDVQWRPPPKSMRGLRKLVRYTVIFLTVSFTCK